MRLVALTGLAVLRLGDVRGALALLLLGALVLGRRGRGRGGGARRGRGRGRGRGDRGVDRRRDGGLGRRLRGGLGRRGGRLVGVRGLGRRLRGVLGRSLGGRLRGSGGRGLRRLRRRGARRRRRRRGIVRQRGHAEHGGEDGRAGKGSDEDSASQGEDGPGAVEFRLPPGVGTAKGALEPWAWGSDPIGTYSQPRLDPEIRQVPGASLRSPGVDAASLEIRIAGPDDASALAATTRLGFESYADWAPDGWQP